MEENLLELSVIFSYFSNWLENALWVQMASI